MLHDLAEITEPDSSNLQQAAEQLSAEIPDTQREILCLDTEEHMHDAVLAFKKIDETHLFQTASKSVLAVFTLSLKSAQEIAKPLQRPPPQAALGLPTHTFLTKRALLI